MSGRLTLMTTANTTGTATLTDGVRAEATIDLAALRGNLAALRERVGSSAVMLAVKADAYGHGAVECAREAVANGVGWLGCATPEEALALRARASARSRPASCAGCGRRAGRGGRRCARTSTSR